MIKTEVIVKRIQKQRLENELKSRNQIRKFEELAPIIDQLPDELSHNYDLFFYATLTEEKDVRRVCAEVREILGVTRSEKSLDRQTGKISYITEGKGIHVKVYGGELPSNCTLIPESHSYITFKMECNDSTSLRE